MSISSDDINLLRAVLFDYRDQPRREMSDETIARLLEVLENAKNNDDGEYDDCVPVY